MWAQGATLGLLLAVGIVAHQRRKHADGAIVSKVSHICLESENANPALNSQRESNYRHDHSWRDAIDGESVEARH